MERIRDKAMEIYCRLPGLMKIMSVCAYVYAPLTDEYKDELLKKFQALNQAIDAFDSPKETETQSRG
jgi:hypothetical protein